MSRLPAEELYEDDFYAWTQLQARELRRFARSRPNLMLDLDHIAEEIRDLGKEQRNAVRSWTARIIEHLLLLEHAPKPEPHTHWRREIGAFRKDVRRRLTATLKRDLARQLPALFNEARDQAILHARDVEAAEMIDDLPETCPYSLEQILGDWWPDDEEG